MKGGVLVFVVLAALVSVWGSPLVPSVGMLNVLFFSAISKAFIEKDPFYTCLLIFGILVCNLSLSTLCPLRHYTFRRSKLTTKRTFFRNQHVICCLLRLRVKKPNNSIFHAKLQLKLVQFKLAYLRLLFRQWRGSGRTVPLRLLQMDGWGD